MTDRLDAPRRALVTTLEKAREAFRETNRPDLLPPDLDQVLDALDTAIETETPELARDLRGIEPRLRDMRLTAPEEEAGEFQRIEYWIYRLRDGVETLRLAAVEAGYPDREDVSDLPSAQTVRRADFAAQLNALQTSIGALAEEIEGMKRQAESEPANETQSALVSFFVERAEVKLALIDLSLKDLVEVLSLGEAIRGLLRLVSSFVRTVKPATAAVSGWLRERAEHLRPKAGAVGRGFGRFVKAVRETIVPAGDGGGGQSQDIDLDDEWDDNRIFGCFVARASIPEDVAANRKTLTLAGWQLRSIQPLAHFRNLERLALLGTNVGDLTPIANLEKLQSLTLSDSSVSNIAPVAKLENLKSLDLAGSNVSDLAPIANLKNLKSLDLSGTKVSDLAPIARLENLKSLVLSRTNVSDLAPIARLENLKSLVLSRTNVSDLAPIAKLKNLLSLALSRTNVSDLAPVANLENLQSLYLAGSTLSDFAPLAKLENLHTLDLANTNVIAVTPLSHIGLRRLDLHGTEVADFQALRSVPLVIAPDGKAWIDGKETETDTSDAWRRYDPEDDPDNEPE